MIVPETQSGRRAQRMPTTHSNSGTRVATERRARSVFGHQRVIEITWRHTQPCGCTIAQPVQCIGQVTRRLEVKRVVVVDATVTHHTPARRVLLVACFFQRQRGDEREQALFFIRGDETRNIVAALGQGCGQVGEQAGLHKAVLNH